MIPREESHNVVRTDTGYIILPMTGVIDYKGDLSKYERVPEGFEYNSATNDSWISVEEFRATLAKQGFKL